MHEQIKLWNPILEIRIEVDKGLSELLMLLWENDIATDNSCQNLNGNVWISFYSSYDLKGFLDLIASCQFPIPIDGWEYKATVLELPRYGFDVTVDVRFPVQYFNKIYSALKIKSE